MKVLVCGGRKGVRAKEVFMVLDRVAELLGSSDIEIAEGRALGVDQAAGAWADHKAHAHWKFPINNEVDGVDPMTAPKRRNQRMLDTFKPDICVGLPGGGGTNDMMDRCHRAGVPVWDIEFKDGGFVIHQWQRQDAPVRLASHVHAF